MLDVFQAQRRPQIASQSRKSRRHLDMGTHAQFAVGNLQLAIVPNPVSETINIRGLETNSIDEVLIYNLVGEKIFSAEQVLCGAVNCKLQIAHCQLSPGLDYIEILSDKKTYRTKFLKQ